VTALRHVLRDVASGAYVVPPEVVRGLAVALDDELAAYVEAVRGEVAG
jgi:hypothetical protein